MVVDELYYGEGRRGKTAPHTASWRAAGESVGIGIDEDVLAEVFREIYASQGGRADAVEPHLFRALAATLTDAVTKGAAPTLGSDPFLDALRHSADVFAAFKSHRAQTDMAARLLDSNGNLKPFEQWRKEVEPIASHQCGAWLETEYNTAVLRARQAAQWQQFEREKDILPNLRWLPSTSPHPGKDHQPFWNTILPVDHPFWNRHRPGDRWNCKCDLTSTDEPATAVPEEASDNDPQPGLRDNPGRSGAVISDDHPYFPEDCHSCPFYKPGFKARMKAVFRAQKKDCFNCPYVDGCVERAREIKHLMKESCQEARKAVQGKTLSNPDFEHSIMVSRASVNEWTNQPFKYMAEKHQMLLDIEKVIRKSEYVGTAGNPKNVKGVITSHIFKTKVLDIEAFIIVLEYDSGEFILHSISDAQDFMKYVTKK